jgi:hypothetical protein
MHVLTKDSVGLLGCIEGGDIPHFTWDDLRGVSPTGYRYECLPYLDGLATAYSIHTELTALLAKIPSYVTSSAATAAEILSAQYRLLAFRSLNQQGVSRDSDLWDPFENFSRCSHRQIVEECLSIGALLYLSLFQPGTTLTSVRPVNYTYLLRQLQHGANLLFCRRAILWDSALLTWLLFLGEIFSLPHDDVGLGARHQLRTVTAEIGISSWEEMRTSLSALCWTQSVQTECYRALWEEISIAS